MDNEIVESNDNEIDVLLSKDELIQALDKDSKINEKSLKDITMRDLLLSNMHTVYDMLVQGESIASICRKIGITKIIWYYVKKNSAQFRNLIEMAEQEQVGNVKSSLVRKTQDKFITAQRVLPNGRIVEYQKFVPSDINAIKFYLLNKASDEFKDKQEVEITRTDIVVDIIDVEDVE